MSKKRLYYLLAVLLLSMVFGRRIFENDIAVVDPGSANKNTGQTTTDSGTASENQRTAAQPENSENPTVIRVIDGDTVVVRLDGAEEKVRLIGIDTPERGKPYYKEATEKTKQLCLSKEVRLIKDVRDRDRYGRLLRYVYVGDMFVNAELVEQGYAMVLTYPPDVKYADLFVSLAAKARAEKVGLWAQ